VGVGEDFGCGEEGGAVVGGEGMCLYLGGGGIIYLSLMVIVIEDVLSTWLRGCDVFIYIHRPHGC